MPPLDEGPELVRARPLIEPSAPMELLWLGHRLLNPRPESSGRFAAMESEQGERIAERLRSFWGDGISGGSGELVVLADYAGLLFARDLDQILDDLPVAGVDLSVVGLRAEAPADRVRFIERLTLLQRDRQVRRRYAGVLRNLWELMRPEWESKGLPEVLLVCQRAGQRLDLGMPLDEVVPAYAEVERKKVEWHNLVESAAEMGRLAMVPGYFGGKWSLWDLPDHVVVGFSSNSDPLMGAKRSGQRLAPRLRALGDPTRLSILLYLAERPTSVGELAHQFEIAQPTVSAHLRSLRGAGLVAGAKSNGRTVYQVDRERLKQLLGDLTESSGIEQSG